MHMNVSASPAAAAPAHPLARRPVSSAPASVPAAVATAITPLPREQAEFNGKTVDVFSLRHRITILSPCYDFSLTEYYHNSVRECMQAQAHFRLEDGTIALLPIIAGRLSLPNDSHIDRARNVLTNLWLRNNQTDLALWWDVDIEKHPEHIMRLFVHAMNGYKFVCGHYAMKCLLPTFVANVLPGTKIDPATGLIELLDGGTGCMLWHRDVPLALQAHPMVKAYACSPNTPFPGEKFYAYFCSGAYGAADDKTGLQNWLSEDWMVCRLWQELGGKVYGDSQIKLRHFGRIMYPPPVSELVEAVLSLIKHNHPALAPSIKPLREACAKYMPPAKSAEQS